MGKLMESFKKFNSWLGNGLRTAFQKYSKTSLIFFNLFKFIQELFNSEKILPYFFSITILISPKHLEPWNKSTDKGFPLDENS